MAKRRRPRGIDLIREGVPRHELHRAGTRAVFSALVRTAMSWQNAGWTFEAWRDTLFEPQSILGVQMRLDSRRRALTATAVRKQLDRAWATAAENVAERPAYGRSEITAWAQTTLDGLDALHADSWPLPDCDRAVLGHLLSEAARLGTTTPVAPARAVQEAVGLKHPMDAWRALRRLADANLLRLVEAGRPGTGSKAAARYAWDTTTLLGLTKSDPYGARDSMHMDMNDTEISKPTPEPADQIVIRLQDGQIATVTIPATTDTRAEVLALLRASGADVHDATGSINGNDENVIPIRRTRTGGMAT